MTTELAKVREELFKKAQLEGQTCPCCDQFVKIYKRSLTSASVVVLINLYKHCLALGAYEWVSLPTLMKEWGLVRSDEAKLVYWSLIEPMMGVREDGSRRNGWYRLTEKGVDFVRGKIKVPKYAYVYNAEVIGHSSGGLYPHEEIWVSDALGSNFNYRELMQASLGVKDEEPV